MQPHPKSVSLGTMNAPAGVGAAQTEHNVLQAALIARNHDSRGPGSPGLLMHEPDLDLWRAL